MIEIGRSYRYKELCEAIGKDNVIGSYKTTLLKSIYKNYEVVHKNGFYKIIREYSQQEKDAKEIKGMYQKLLEAILSNFLSQQDNYSVCTSMMELLLACGIINTDFKYCRYNIDSSSKILKSDPYDLEEYITKSYNLLSRMFKDILDQLENKALIKCRKGYKLFKVNNMGLQSGSKVVTLGSKEETIIIKAEEEGLKEMGLTKLFEVYRNEISIETFKKITNRKIKEQFPDYDGYYKVYHITLNRTGLWENKNNIYKELNKKIQTKLLKNKGLSEITQLKKMVDATINLSRPFKIQENLKIMKKLEGENNNE